MIAVLDYGMGNVGSIVNMLRKIGSPCLCSANLSELKSADKWILPGVGAFDAGMARLRALGLEAAIHDHVKAGKVLLGICLGMQMLGRKSEEGVTPGLCLLPFDTIAFRIPTETKLKVPHMGWNRVTVAKETLLTGGLSSKERYYFVHSFHAKCDDNANILMTCEYGITFTCAVAGGNVYGTQFHPEKSHDYGLRLLKNFAEKV
jgi:imidazole glycerol-phosphate synthase subunit HisH